MRIKNSLQNSLRYGLAVLAACSILAAAEHRGIVKFGGLPLPGATVTATQGDKRLTAISDPGGAYSFPDLANGTWSLKVEMLCFAPLEREVAVAPDAPSPEWEMKLLPFEEIKASAPPPPVVSSAPAAGTGATPAASNGTSPVAPAPTTAAAAPKKGAKLPKGVAPPQAANSSTGFQRTEAKASPNGASPGAATAPPPDNSANANGGSAPVEATSAPADGFLINGSVNNGASTPFAQSAAFGNNRRGMRSLYNGSLGVVIDDSSLNARAFSLTGQDTPKPASSHVQGLANFGGPLKIPHLVPRNGPNLTFNYQWLRNRNANTQTNRVPTLAERVGDFSQSVDALGKAVKIVDPSTGTPFAGNIVPANFISPQARALVGFFPTPNFDSNSRYNYQIPLVGSVHQDSFQGRGGRSVGRKNNVNGGFGMQSTRSDNTNLFGFLDTNGSLGMQANANWMHRFGMRMFMNMGLTFSRASAHGTPFFAGVSNISALAGITGNNQEPFNWGPPNLSFSSGIAGLSDIQHSSTKNQTTALSGSLFRSQRSHNLTVGGDIRKLQFNQISQQDARGSFTFTGAAAGYDFAGFLLGVPDASSIAFGNADKYFRGGSYDAYLSDDWRVSPSLTLNLGLRWEYTTPVTERYGRLVNLDITSGYAATSPVLASNPTGALTGQHYSTSLVDPDKRGVQPKIGLSWRPLLASSMVIRAGYGMNYDTSIYMPIVTRMAQQSPLSKSLSVPNTPANPLTLANGFNAAPNITPNTFAVDPHLRLGYVHSWQVSVQRDLPYSMVMTATYLGIKGTHAQQQFFPNTYPAGVTSPCPTCSSGYVYLTSNGNSTRESGTVQLRRRLHNGFTSTLQYTYSKAIDNALLGGQGSAVIAQDWLNLSAERGLSNFDQRHQFRIDGQYTSGMGLGGGTLLSGWRGRAVKDWTFSSGLNLASGTPLTPIYSQVVRGTGVSGSIRPDYTGAPLYGPPPGLFLNPAAVTAPAAGHWGNAGRNSIIGPGRFGLNASMSRTFRFSDRVNADFRLDAANVLNHVTFPNWNTNVSSSQFGLPNSANSMRTVQSTLRVRF